MGSVKLQLEDAGRAWRIPTLGGVRVHSETGVTKTIQSACEQTIVDSRTLETSVEFTPHSDATATLEAASLKLQDRHPTHQSGSTGHL